MYTICKIGLNGEEIAGLHWCPLMVQERPPVAVHPVSLGRRQNVVTPPHISHGGNAHVIAQLVQFALDLFLPQAGISSARAHDRRFEFLVHTGPLHLSPALKRPWLE